MFVVKRKLINRSARAELSDGSAVCGTQWSSDGGRVAADESCMLSLMASLGDGLPCMNRSPSEHTKR